MTERSPLEWSTPPVAVAALAVGGVVLAVAAMFAVPDAVGKVLIGFAALLVLSMALTAARQRPRLEVLGDSDGPASGIATTRLTGRREFPRAQLHRVRIVRYPRLGRRVPMLEIDTLDPETGDERLMIFGRWDLGTDPRDVYDALAVHGLAPDHTPN